MIPWRKLRSWTRWSDLKFVMAKGEFWLVVVAVAAIGFALGNK